MTRFRWESDLADPVAAYLRGRSFRLQGVEVPFYEYRIDLYGYSRRESLTLALELKLTNWRRALQQTIIYQLTADLVYAALPTDNLTSQVQDAFSTYGIGLIGVGSNLRCRQVLAAQQSRDVRAWYREHFVSLVSKR
jgi:hypothetical protein